MQFKTSVLGAAFVLGIALPSLAQNGTMAPMSGTPTPMGSTMAPATMMAMSPQDQLFVVRAAEGNLAEITLAQMALQKSKTPSVKNVAQTIITGHTQAQTELLATASRKGMTLRPMLSVTHVAVSERLKKAKGANFDKMYMANQTDDHENTIALFQTQVAAGQDDDLKAYASKYLPDIVGHTIMIYTVARQVGAPGSEMRPPTPPVPPGVTPTMMPMDPSMTPSM
jgi:putative membrane protein